MGKFALWTTSLPVCASCPARLRKAYNGSPYRPAWCVRDRVFVNASKFFELRQEMDLHEKKHRAHAHRGNKGAPNPGAHHCSKLHAGGNDRSLFETGTSPALSFR